ncbi:MAG TPA: hypothetical protein VKB86_07390 [Pyrinomonadaceae bacterium]|nr:hypothetical protein [Pyrinomonadaceae bacterium]
MKRLGTKGVNIFAPEVRTECFFARLQRAESYCTMNQTFHVWLPSPSRLRG